MSEDYKYDRRRFIGTAAMTVAAAQLGAFSPAAKAEKVNATINSSTSFGPLKQIEAGLLTITRRIRAGNAAVAMRLSRNGDALWVLYRDPAGLVEIPFDTLRP